MTSTIQLRRGTASDWTSANPILSLGEAGFETDTKRLKIGDGSSNWNTLDYFSSTQAINAQTGTTYTPLVTDENKLVTLSNTSAITVTLPQDSDLTFAVGKRIDFLVINTGMATFQAGSGATVQATPSAVTRARWSAVTALKLSSNTWVVIGDLA